MSRDTGQRIPCFASHYNQKAINSWLSFPFLYEYGVPQIIVLTVFRYLILISIDFYNFISLFILSFNFWLKRYIKTAFDQICKHLNVSIVKSTLLRIKYSTLFSVFWNVVRHGLSGFDLLPNSERAIFVEPFVNVVCKCLSFNCLRFFCYLFNHKLNFYPFVSF